MNLAIREAIGARDVNALLSAWQVARSEDGRPRRRQRSLLTELSLDELQEVCHLTEEAVLAAQQVPVRGNDALGALNDEAQTASWRRRYGAESQTTLYLDTETTGLNPGFPHDDKIVEVAIIDGAGAVRLDTLLNPGRPIPQRASQIHGITDSMVESEPTLEELWPQIRGLVEGQHVVIYNADFDCGFFPNRLRNAARISCAMLRFAEVFGERKGRDGYKWQPLALASAHVGHEWTGEAHRALADAQACRSVWQWLEMRGLG